LDANDSLILTLQLFGHFYLPVTLFTLFGLLGNALFTCRVLVQWIASERAGRTVVPVSFWWLSVAATSIYIIYAYLDHEMPFLLGFTVTLVPYVRNLVIAYRPHRPPRSSIRIGLTAALLCLTSIIIFTKQREFSGWFMVSLAGNAIFGSRFFVQWIQSEARRKNVMTLPFWYLSLAGSVILLTYSLSQGKIVFILAFIFNVIPYARNIILIHRHRRRRQAPACEALG
jgi:lipid-A-disaccharide synthase-like uncharacterized protein